MPAQNPTHQAMNEAYDDIVARLDAEERARAARYAQDKGATPDETMGNAFDRVHGLRTKDHLLRPEDAGLRPVNAIFFRPRIDDARPVLLGHTTEPADEFPESPLTFEYRDKHHQRESQNAPTGEGVNYTSKSIPGSFPPYGAHGRYQMTRPALKDIKA